MMIVRKSQKAELESPLIQGNATRLRAKMREDALEVVGNGQALIKADNSKT